MSAELFVDGTGLHVFEDIIHDWRGAEQYISLIIPLSKDKVAIRGLSTYSP